MLSCSLVAGSVRTCGWAGQSHGRVQPFARTALGRAGLGAGRAPAGRRGRPSGTRSHAQVGTRLRPKSLDAGRPRGCHEVSCRTTSRPLAARRVRRGAALQVAGFFLTACGAGPDRAGVARPIALAEAVRWTRTVALEGRRPRPSSSTSRSRRTRGAGSSRWTPARRSSGATGPAAGSCGARGPGVVGRASASSRGSRCASARARCSWRRSAGGSPSSTPPAGAWSPPCERRSSGWTTRSSSTTRSSWSPARSRARRRGPRSTSTASAATGSCGASSRRPWRPNIGRWRSWPGRRRSRSGARRWPPSSR